VHVARDIHVRNVPDGVHQELARRAKARGQSLTGYVKEILEREVSRPAREEVFERIRQLPPVQLDRPVADLIREERAEQERRWTEP
jgi:plasmid stability protein